MTISDKPDAPEAVRAKHAEEAFARPLYNVWKQQEKDGRFQTFEAYCKGVWNLGQSHAYRLIDLSDAFVLLSVAARHHRRPCSISSPNPAHIE